MKSRVTGRSSDINVVLCPSAAGSIARPLDAEYRTPRCSLQAQVPRSNDRTCFPSLKKGYLIQVCVPFPELIACWPDGLA